MEVEIFLHGTPKGYNYVGKSDEFSYCSTFYTNRNESEKLVIEIRNSVNKVYCYYTYIKSKNVSSIDMRPGGYVAITVRIDNYCKDTIAIFYILKSIYRKHVIGNFVQEVGDTTKYIVESLSVKEGELDNMMRTLVQLLSLQILSTDFVPVRMESMPNKKGSEQQFNLLDCSTEKVLNAIQRNGRVSVSLIYPSAQERQLREAMECEIKNMSHKLKSELRQQEMQFKDLLSQNKDFHVEIENIRQKLNSSEEDKLHLLNENAKLKSIINDLENKEKKLSEQANLRDEIAKVSEPILKLNGLLQRYGISGPPLQKSQPSMRRFDSVFEKRRPEKVSSFKNSNIWKIALMIFALASILQFIVLFFQIKLYSKYNNSYVEEPKVENVQVGDINEKKGQALTKIEDLEEFDQKKDEMENARIDIKGQNTYPDGLVEETRYPIGLVTKEGNYVDSLIDIKWDCRGGYVDPKHGNKVSLRTKKTGTIQIFCYLPNGQTITRELKVYEKKTDQHSSSHIRKDSKITIPNSPSSISGKEKSKRSEL